MATYQIRPERATLHGIFSRELPPVLTIQSGDTVRFQTLDAGWHVEPRRSADPNERPHVFEPRDPDRDAGHALCGPVAIQGAEPGMTLAIHINEIRPGSWGFTASGGWSSRVNTRMGVSEPPGIIHLWRIDADAMTGRNQHGYEVNLHPFMGVLGMPPDAPGWHSTVPPRVSGGNLDCRELVAGSTLYLPVSVPGALVSVGDGHAAQGDGEVSQTAIECPMERVDLTFELLPDLRITTPRAETPAGWLTMGVHEDLHEATMLALEAMLDLMGERYGLARMDALALASVVVDLRVTQLVNGGVVGAHAVLPHHRLRAPEAR
ncbi:MAG TPA: acetamidase/formamidase family protein [Ktedonobacterales bacterium]|jgi:acetamidase/formamidase|nr:acetamidase/formamidase family protein [Ktedonobacterales bacterium]